MASGRGQSHFNVNDFLQPFMKNQGLVRYPMNVNTSNDYYRDEKEARDKTSFLPNCGYSKRKATETETPGRRGSRHVSRVRGTHECRLGVAGKQAQK